jgi:hypothetical protein
MEHPIIANSLLAAHTDRVLELARLYDLLERTAASTGAASDGTRKVHRALTARIVDWETADGEAERRDVVALTAEEREPLLRILPAMPPEIDTIGAYVQSHLTPPLRPGRSVELGGFRFTAIEIRDGRIRRLRGDPLPEATGDESGEG